MCKLQAIVSQVSEVIFEGKLKWICKDFNRRTPKHKEEIHLKALTSKCCAWQIMALATLITPLVEFCVRLSWTTDSTGPKLAQDFACGCCACLWIRSSHMRSKSLTLRCLVEGHMRLPVLLLQRSETSVHKQDNQRKHQNIAEYHRLHSWNLWGRLHHCSTGLLKLGTCTFKSWSKCAASAGLAAFDYSLYQHVWNVWNIWVALFQCCNPCLLRFVQNTALRPRLRRNERNGNLKVSE